jgi:hypothetical protein
MSNRYQHGTRQGFTVHKVEGTKPCDPCKKAAADFYVRWQAAAKAGTLEAFRQTERTESFVPAYSTDRSQGQLRLAMSNPVSISKPDGATAVCFKDEDHVEGMRIGPVYFYVADLEADTVEFVPVYSTDLDFTGQPAAGWLTYREATKLARHFSLPIEEV